MPAFSETAADFFIFVSPTTGSDQRVWFERALVIIVRSALQV